MSIVFFEKKNKLQLINAYHLKNSIKDHLRFKKDNNNNNNKNTK